MPTGGCRKGISYQVIFGRGYSPAALVNEQWQKQHRHSEFTWQSKDGSEVLAVHLPFWYNNAQRFSEDIGKSLKCLERIEENSGSRALTPYLLLMNGVDHLEAQENLTPILAGLNRHLPAEKKIRQIAFPEYLSLVRRHLAQQKPEEFTVYTGELRAGTDINHLKNTLSSRIYLKKQNTDAQRLIESYLEPLYSFISMAGADALYPRDYLLYLWKLLIQNHPHDSICGCSRDIVHDNMEDRSARIMEAGGELLERGLDFIALHSGGPAVRPEDYLITAVNTIESRRSAVLDIAIQFPAEENAAGFQIVDDANRPVPFTVTKKEQILRSVFSPINLPGMKTVDAFAAQVYLDAIDGLSVKTLRVLPDPKRACAIVKPVRETVSAAAIENEHLSVAVQSDGRIQLTQKSNGAVYTDVLTIEETEDRGNSYQFIRSPNGKTFTLRDTPPAISKEVISPFESVVTIACDWHLPERYDCDAGERSTALVSNPVSIRLSLRKNEPYLRAAFTIDNRSKDHRIRAIIRTGISSHKHRTLIPFEVVERTNIGYADGYREGDEPTSGFVTASDEAKGFSMFTDGIFEYMHREGDGGEYAFTLVRGNGTITANEKTTSEHWYAPGNQCLRVIDLAMALYPHNVDQPIGDITKIYRDFSVPMLSRYQAADIRKFTGGRPCVQDSEIAEIFYRPDPYARVRLPAAQTFLGISGRNVVLSAVKKSEDGKQYVVRVFNIGDEKTTFTLRCGKPFASVVLLRLDERKVRALAWKGSVTKPIPLKPGEIATIGYC